MKTLREAILTGVRAAAEAHVAFRIRDRVEAEAGAIDVFGTIEALEVPLVFRPLEGLLGACVRLGANAGILVTTQRDLHLQRFTAAHELGHFVLEHEGSLDREVLLPGEQQGRDLNEIAADAFAAEFLMPRWLYVTHAKRHGWTASRLTDPSVVYQLSLRMAVSYEAACWGLLSHRILNASAVANVRTVTPKKSKELALAGVPLTNPWADVWVLDESDDGGMLEADPTDLIVLDMLEHAGSGYLWDEQALASSGFVILSDERRDDGTEAVGGPVRRRMVIQVPPPGVHRLSIAEARPWSGGNECFRTLTVRVSTYGKEVEGLPRRARASLPAPSVH